METYTRLQQQGKFFAAIISLVGIGIIAIPTGIISAGFTSLIGKDKEEPDKKNYCPYCGHKLDDNSAISHSK